MADSIWRIAEEQNAHDRLRVRVQFILGHAGFSVNQAISHMPSAIGS
jgi:hypothetical protein